MQFTRELGNLPPNICNPAYLAEQAQEFAAELDNVSCEVLERAEMEELGMGSLLAVARGSANPPQADRAALHRRRRCQAATRWSARASPSTPAASTSRPQGGIEEMKFDMCGAASVMGTFLAAVGMQLPINLVVIVPAVENMPDADAYRPSDVLTAMTGKTIEVGNTDAEGRLILCDALTYAQRFEPQATVDVATLTGACVIALGKYATGLMSKHDDLADELLDAGENVFDRAWRLPLWDEYQTHARFHLRRHLQHRRQAAPARSPPAASCRASPKASAGRTWTSPASSNGEGRKGMATGRPVGLLSQWLLDQAGV